MCIKRLFSNQAQLLQDYNTPMLCSPSVTKEHTFSWTFNPGAQVVYIRNILQDICAQSWLSTSVLCHMYLSSFKTRNQILHWSSRFFVFFFKTDPSIFFSRITDISHTSLNTGSISYYGKQNTSWSFYFSNTGSLPRKPRIICKIPMENTLKYIGSPVLRSFKE